MGEKFTNIAFGITIDDAGDCPHEDGWVEFLYKHSFFADKRYERSFKGSYESTPEWFGFLVCCLAYGETLILSNEDDMDMYVEAETAWNFLRSTLEKEGINLPAGILIIAHDG